MLFNSAEWYHDVTDNHTNWQPIAAIIMTSHTDVVTAFTAALADFPVGRNRPDDAYVQKTFDTIVTILYSLEYDTVNGVHNLMGIIEDTLAYSNKYGEAFPVPKRPKAFDDSIDTKEAVSPAS